MNKQKLKFSEKDEIITCRETLYASQLWPYYYACVKSTSFALYCCDVTICRNNIFSSCNLIRKEHTMWHEKIEVILSLLHDARNQTSWHFMQHFVPQQNFPQKDPKTCMSYEGNCHWNMPPCHVRVAFPLACATLYKQLNSIELGKMGD